MPMKRVSHSPGRIGHRKSLCTSKKNSARVGTVLAFQSRPSACHDRV